MSTFKRWTDLGRRIGRSLLAHVQTTAGRSFFGGALAALFVVAFWHQAMGRFGDTLSVQGGAVLAIGLGILAGMLAGTWIGPPRRWRAAWALAPAGWLLAVPWLADGVSTCCRATDLERFADPAVQWAVGCSVSLVLFGVPTAVAIWLVLSRRNVHSGWLLCGGAAGLIAAADLIAPWFGLQGSVWLAVAGSLGAAAASLRRTVAAHDRPSSWSRPPGSAVVVSIAASLLVGGLIAGLKRMASQLFPESEALEWTAWAGFLVGAATAWAYARRAQDRDRAAAQAVLASACGALVPLVLFSALTDLCLFLTAGVSQVFLLFLIRGALVFAAMFPAGALWSAASDAGRRTDDSAAGAWVRLLWCAPAVGAGFVAARWLVPHGFGIAPLIAAACVLLAAGSLARRIAAGMGSAATAMARPGASTSVLADRGAPAARNQFVERSEAGGIRLAVLAAAAFGLVVVLAASGQRPTAFNPGRAVRLLFSTNVFVARREGTEARLLPFLDDGRLVAIADGDRGTYSLWRQRGVQFALRCNGIPLGTFCERPDVCPRVSGEVLPAILPLLLHEAPRRVLMLGMGSGTGLSACLEFPVEEITCVESDRAMIELLERAAWPGGAAGPRGDGRVRMVTAEPACAVQARPGEFDAIVADTEQAAVSGGTPYFTREFYAGVNRQLAEGGIFAQRFQRIDFGPWPIRSVLATLCQVFSQVAAVEAGPGELVLLATNSERGLSRPGLLTRFQTPQADRVFSQLGWDWSVALNLAALGRDGCRALAEGTSVNTASNGLFAFRLPQETMRWGPKPQEVAAALASHATRMAEWPGVDANDAELLRRLSDVVTQRQLMTAYPDQPWAYRKIVREEMKKHPHTVIDEGEEGLERKLHPMDRRRLHYFAALGKAAKSRRPSADDLRAIEEFASPYDAELTYFIHHELAALYARSDLADSRDELSHRLYAVYYSDTRDRSVRDVADALALLCRENAAASPVERWDHLNALLEILKYRWMNRGLGRPESTRIVLNDVDKSIYAAEAAFDAMEKLCPQTGFAPADWHARRDVLERLLVRPLRSYRTELVRTYSTASRQNAN